MPEKSEEFESSIDSDNEQADISKLTFGRFNSIIIK